MGEEGVAPGVKAISLHTMTPVSQERRSSPGWVFDVNLKSGVTKTAPRRLSVSPRQIPLRQNPAHRVD